MKLTAPLLALLIVSYTQAQAQDACHFILSGSVYDATSNSNLSLASLYIKEVDRGSVANPDGHYSIADLCPGKYTVTCSFLGYKTVTREHTLKESGILNFVMRQDSSTIAEVVVTGQKDGERALVTQQMSDIKGNEITQSRGASLGEALTGVTGVYALQTGPSIFKPVIHGLHSNRVLILNNGVRLEGQQWGSEHAPEIDPFIATRLSVIKGAASIRYGSDAIGGVVSAEPAPLPTEKRVHGEMNLVAATNNRLGVVSAIAEGALDKKLDGFSWRMQATIRRAGNAATPHYYVENTGFREVNASGALGYRKGNFGAEAYVSEFSTMLGIFTGSDASSISDIQQHIAQPRPSTPSYFSYVIDRPYQQVTHQLMKANAWYSFRNKSRLDIIVARQQNNRSEYDFTPLNGRENPELFLKLVTHTADAIYHFSKRGKYSATAGFNGMTQGNVRKYEMLIPNFRNYGGGIFYIGKWISERITLEGGARYDYRWLRAYLLDNNSAQVITPTWAWQNVTGTAGMEYLISDNLSWNVNGGTAWRAPAVSELLSGGVHQSAGDYENGNQNLKLERAYNLSSSVRYDSRALQLEIGVYNNLINGYIFLKPDNTFIHTVRGSKPSFTYTQVDARFRGADISVTLRPVDSLSLSTKESLLYAWNKTIHDYLQLVPANRFENSVRYGFGNIGSWKMFYARLTATYTSRQKRVPLNSDFTAPPPDYLLVNAVIGWRVPVGHRLANVTLSANNLFNVAYRDYMDRFRYFTDEPGRNILIRLRVPF